MSDTATNETRLHVEGMSCGGCVRSVTAILARTLGMEREDVEVDLDAESATIHGLPDPDKLTEAIERLSTKGFEARPVS